jgi:predicted lipoprotein with Yx(FWY)xxD motif
MSAGGVTVTTANSSDGVHLTDASGHTLYMWVADKDGKSACSGACAAVWPPLTTKGKPAASGGAMASDLGTVARSDGSMQVTYSGHPLYYYASDSKAGDITGQGSNGYGAKWCIVAPSGTAITSSGSSSSSGSSGGGSTGGGGGGYGY